MLSNVSKSPRFITFVLGEERACVEGVRRGTSVFFLSIPRLNSISIDVILLDIIQCKMASRPLFFSFSFASKESDVLKLQHKIFTHDWLMLKVFYRRSWISSCSMWVQPRQQSRAFQKHQPLSFQLRPKKQRPKSSKRMTILPNWRRGRTLELELWVWHLMLLLYERHLCRAGEVGEGERCVLFCGLGIWCMFGVRGRMISIAFLYERKLSERLR